MAGDDQFQSLQSFSVGAGFATLAVQVQSYLSSITHCFAR